MDKDNFELFERLGEVYINDNDKHFLEELLKYNITQENVYEILKVADFYQYKKMNELTERIQLLILEEKIKIEYEKLNKEDLYNSIFINDCLKEGKIKCDLAEKIHDVCCVKYLEGQGYKCDIWAINNAAYGGHIETIKYLHSQGYKGTIDAINWAALNGHIETIKYLESQGYKGDKWAINYAAKNGHIETIKYLESQGYKGDKWAINYAAKNGHIETIKYLDSQGYKGDRGAINYAAQKGHIETIKYLNSQGYKGDDWAINYAAKNGHIETIKYLIEQKYNFRYYVIKEAKTQEIRELLVANMHLMFK